MLGKGSTAVDAAGAGGPGLDRRSRRREATKAEILEAAWVLARSEGLTNFSMRDVATRVGMQAPSLYQYFDSKHAIYDAMFGQGAQQSLEFVCADLPTDVDPSNPRSVLLEIARRVFDFATSDPARMQLLFQRTIPGFEPSPASYAPAIEMSATVQVVMGDLGFTDPDAMDLFTAMVSGLVNQQLSNDPGGTRWTRLLGRTVDMFIDEMTRRPRTTAGSGDPAKPRSTGSTRNARSTRSKTTTTGTNKKRGT